MCLEFSHQKLGKMNHDEAIFDLCIFFKWEYSPTIDLVNKSSRCSAVTSVKSVGFQAMELGAGIALPPFWGFMIHDTFFCWFPFGLLVI